MDYKKIVRDEREKAAALRANHKELNIKAITYKVELFAERSDSQNSDENVESETTSSTVRMPFFLKSFVAEKQRVGNMPNLFYVPQIMTVTDEIQLLESIAFAGTISGDVWMQLRKRRLQSWGKNTAGDSCRDSPLPLWLQEISDELVRSCVFRESDAPNHVLINEYKSDEGILHHTDGPIYHNLVAILSLGSTCLMTFRHKLESHDIGHHRSEDIFSVVLQPRSLLIFSDYIYSMFMHGIADGVTSEIVGCTAPCLNMHLAGVEEGHVVSKGKPSDKFL